MTSAAGSEPAAATVFEWTIPRRRPWRKFGRLVRRNPVGLVALLVLIVLCLIALFAEQVAPYSPRTPGLAGGLEGPSSSHWLGTDRIGRDVLSRLIYGARISLWVGFLSVGSGILVGTIIGMVSGFVGGTLDLVVQRFMDMMMAIPALLLAMVLIASFGAGQNNAMIAIAIVLTPTAARVMRSVVLQVKARMYVESARASGASEARVLFRHILPNSVDEVLILASVALASAVIIESALSFLGLGAQAPTPSWGNMLNEGRVSFERGPHMVWAPSAAIALTVLVVTLIGDTLRDILDPKTRDGRSKLGG
jgi:peptide/nickel transport system permease protein